eukprot:ANDGO_01586.mRNA.1 hypothetical protein
MGCASEWWPLREVACIVLCTLLSLSEAQSFPYPCQQAGSTTVIQNSLYGSVQFNVDASVMAAQLSCQVRFEPNSTLIAALKISNPVACFTVGTLKFSGTAAVHDYSVYAYFNKTSPDFVFLAKKSCTGCITAGYYTSTFCSAVGASLAISFLMEQTSTFRLLWSMQSFDNPGDGGSGGGGGDGDGGMGGRGVSTGIGVAVAAVVILAVGFSVRRFIQNRKPVQQNAAEAVRAVPHTRELSDSPYVRLERHDPAPVYYY